jgi:hypothetical protein
MDFPTKSLDRLDLRLAADGTLLVVADDKLMRVGGDGRPTAEMALPNAQKEFEPWYLQSSTTGHTVRGSLFGNQRLGSLLEGVFSGVDVGQRHGGSDFGIEHVLARGCQ